MTTKLVPQDIRQHWDKVRPYIERIKDEYPDSMTERPEDIYAACVNGDAAFYVTEDGFAICALDHDQYSGEVDFLVWVAARFEGSPKGAIKRYLPSFIDIAREYGCAAIKLHSKGEVFHEKHEWKVVHTTYRMVL